MKLNPAHWGRPSMPCTQWMSPKGKLPAGNAATEPSACSQQELAQCPLPPLCTHRLLLPAASAQGCRSAVTCWVCSSFYLPIITGRGVPYSAEVHCSDMRPSPNPRCKQREPVAFGSLRAGKQHGCPRRLSRTEESICSGKRGFPWEGHVWQFKAESFVDKTADFRGIKAFKMDRSAWHTKREAFGSSVTLGVLDALNTHTPFGWLSLSSADGVTRSFSPPQPDTERRLVYWWATRLFHSTMLDFSFSHLQKSKYSHTYHLAVTPQNSLFPFQVEIYRFVTLWGLDEWSPASCQEHRQLWLCAPLCCAAVN